MLQQLSLLQFDGLVPQIKTMVTLFALLTSFTMVLMTKKRKLIPKAPPLFTLDSNGFILDSQLKIFMLDEIVYIPRRRPVALNMSPSVPVDELSERSAYATLLLHVPWSVESEIYGSFDSAIEQLAYLHEQDCVPDHVNVHRARRRASESLLANVGMIQSILPCQYDGHDNHINIDGFYDHEPDECEYITPINQKFTTDEEGVNFISPADLHYYGNFIRGAHKAFMDNYAADNQYSPLSGDNGFVTGPEHYHEGGYRVSNWEARKAQLTLEIANLKVMQRDVYNYVDAKLSTGESDIIFLSGEGGTGKSYTVRLLQENCRLKFGKMLGSYGSCLVLGPTGCASNNVGGFTWQSALGAGRNWKEARAVSEETKRLVGRRIVGIKLLILEEISMISAQDLHEIEHRIKMGLLAMTDDVDKRAQVAKSPFGGILVVFSGDLWQLDPVASKYRNKIFAVANIGIDDERTLRGKFLWSLISKENCRFTNIEDSPLAKFALGARIGQPDEQLLLEMNAHCLAGDGENALFDALRQHPNGSRMVVLAPTHKVVDSINRKLNESLIRGGVFRHRLIATHSTTYGAASEEEEQSCLKIYNNDFAAPIIECCVGARIKIEDNIATQLGLFNGSMGTVHSFGCVVRGNIPIIEVVFVTMDKIIDDLTCDKSNLMPIQSLIPLVPLVSQTKLNKKFYRRQFPFSIAFARTVHSAQGITSEAGIIVAYPTIGNPFARGLEYVMISRATLRDNIILMSPLYAWHFNHWKFQADRDFISAEYTRLGRL